VNPHPEPGPIPAGPSLRAPIAGTVVLVSLWAIFTLFAWPLAPRIADAADRVEELLGLDLNPGRAADSKPAEVVGDTDQKPKFVAPKPKPKPRTAVPR
jgi:hypothetical protein